MPAGVIWTGRIARLAGRILAACVRVRHRRARTPTVRFAIVCMGRTGSTLLQTMLDSHPDIHCFSELIGPDGDFTGWSVADVVAFVDRHFASADAPVAGFKMPWDSLLYFPAIWDVFRKREFRVVLLTRQNKLDQYLSTKLAQHNNVWHSIYGRYTDEHLHVDPADCVQHLRYFRLGESLLREATRGFPRVEVEYQQVVSQAGLAPIFDLLGVQPRVLTPGVERLRHGSHRDIVQNYDEVKAALRGTAWEGDLDA